jgi:AraC family transcriptional regulator
MTLGDRLKSAPSAPDDDCLAQIQPGIELIEARISGEFELELREVSRAAGMSHWHFLRIFKALTGETLMRYVRRRRLSNAARILLEETDRVRLIELALKAGFESLASFTRAFKARFEMTPGRFRTARPENFVPKARSSADYLRHLSGGVSLEPELVDLPAMRLVGLQSCIYGSDSEKNNVADHLPGLWADFLARLPEVPDHERGVAYGLIDQVAVDDERLNYWAGVMSAGPIPEGMVEVIVPPRRVARFTHQGPVLALDHTVNYIYSTWPPRVRAPAQLRPRSGDLRARLSSNPSRFADPLRCTHRSLSDPLGFTRAGTRSRVSAVPSAGLLQVAAVLLLAQPCASPDRAWAARRIRYAQPVRLRERRAGVGPGPALGSRPVAVG